MSRQAAAAPALQPILEPRSRRVVEERELRWIAYQLLSSIALGVTGAFVTRAFGFKQWWLNLVALPLLGVASATGSVLGGAAIFRGWYRLTRRVAPNDWIVNGRIGGATLMALPARALLARYLVGRAWPTGSPLPPLVWGLLPVPLALALVALDDEAEAAATERAQRRLDAVSGARSDGALIEDLKALTEAGISFSLVAFDLDGFREVNNEIGHPAANQMLRDIATSLRALEPEVVTYRLHGDEFALVVAGDDTAVEARVRETARAIARVARSSARTLSASFGVARVGIVPFGGAELRKSADDLSLRAKRLGKDRVAFTAERVVHLMTRDDSA